MTWQTNDLSATNPANLRVPVDNGTVGGSVSAASLMTGALVETTYNASGAIPAAGGTAVLSSATPLAMTLSNGATTPFRIAIKRQNGSGGAHTIAATIDGAATTLTLGSTVGGEGVVVEWSPTLGYYLLLDRFDPAVDAASLGTAAVAPDADKLLGLTASDGKYRLYPLNVVRGKRCHTYSFAMGKVVTAATMSVVIPNAATILSLVTDAGFGSSQTFTVAASIGGIAITGASLNVVGGTAAAAAATANNVLAASSGGTVVLTFSAPSNSPTGGHITLIWQE